MGEWLDGGNVTAVERIGDTVRRAIGPWSPAVHALLRHLEHVGFEAAPRFRGLDEQGREILSFIDGDVPTGAHPAIVTDQAMHDVGRLIRELHVAVADFALPPDTKWHFRSLGGPLPHVACHHDLSPKNTVFRNGRAIAFIDWDMATLEAPIHDVVHAAWQFVPLATDVECVRQGWASPPDRGRRLRILLDSYGLPAADRIGFSMLVAERMESSASGIEKLGASGQAPFERLVNQDVPQRIRVDRDWVREHADCLDRAIRD